MCCGREAGPILFVFKHWRSGQMSSQPICKSGPVSIIVSFRRHTLLFLKSFIYVVFLFVFLTSRSKHEYCVLKFGRLN